MKDNRFIELVNLYIDRQISPVEAAELEAEMQANPRRRDIYRQYCQMHRATTLVYESFRADAPEQAGLAKGRATIARFESQQRHQRSRWAYYAGGLAAVAASLAVVFVRLNTTPAADTNLPTVALQSNQAATAVAVAPTPAPQLRANPENRATLASLQSSKLAAEQDYAAMLVALRQEEQRAFATGQIQSNRLPSLFEDGVFETQQRFPANYQRVFRSKQTPAQQAEFTAFQFQR